MVRCCSVIWTLKGLCEFHKKLSKSIFIPLWDSSNWRSRTEVWLIEQTLGSDCMSSESQLIHWPARWPTGSYLPSLRSNVLTFTNTNHPCLWEDFTSPPHWYQAWRETCFDQWNVSERNMCNFWAETWRARTKLAILSFSLWSAAFEKEAGQGLGVRIPWSQAADPPLTSDGVRNISLYF